MRIIIQRVKKSEVLIDGSELRTTGGGLLLLVGICQTDDEKTAKFMAEKAANLRIFSDEKGAMNLSLLDVDGEAMVISNFTLYADCRKGRRPYFIEAAPPAYSRPLYEYFVKALKNTGVREIKTGEFGADMQVSLVNDGPVTIMLDSAEIMK